MSESPEHKHGPAPRLARDLTLYLLARFGLVVVVAAILLVLGVPLVVALAVGFVIGIPVGFLILRPLNRRVSAGLAMRRQRREQQRATLRAQLRGDTGSYGDPDPGGGSGQPGNEDETRGSD